MMYSVSAITPPTSPTTPQASVASVIANQQPALGRLTPQPVSAAVSYTELHNDARSAQTYVHASPELSTPAAPANADATPDSAPYFVSGRVTSFPSLFLAQVIAQGDSGASNMLNVYEALMAMGDVKYKPSNAGKPSTPSPGLDFLKNLGASQGAAANQNTTPAPPANTNQQLGLFTPSTPTESKPAQRFQAGTPVKPLSPSLARARGADAYSMSAVRIAIFAQETQPETAMETLIA